MMNRPLFPELFQVAEIEVSYHNHTPYQDRIKVPKPSVAYDIFSASWDPDKIELIEQCKILLLNQSSHCLGIVNLTSGTVNYCPLDARAVLAPALKANATAIVLAHNHPSCSLNPSQNDIEATKRIVKSAKLLDMFVMDHIIFCKQGYFSFAENKIMPK